MQAIVISQSGGPEVLKLVEVAAPTAQRGEVLIKIHATALNRADLIQRAGFYPAPRDVSQDIPGMEFAGEIAAIGENVFDWEIGDRVFGLTGGGAYAQYLVVHQRTICRIPDGLNYEDAAALPESCITAWDAMITQAKLQPGETILINGVTSGVGTTAIQIAHAINARIIGTTRSSDKIEKLKTMGLNNIIVIKDPVFADEVLKKTKKAGVEVVLELIGGDYLNEDLKCTKYQGRIMLVGLLAGAKSQIDLSKILSKRIQVTGTSLRTRPLEQKIAATQTFATSVVPLIEDGKIKAVIDTIYTLQEAAKAHQHLADNTTFGKIILKISH